MASFIYVQHRRDAIYNKIAMNYNCTHILQNSQIEHHIQSRVCVLLYVHVDNVIGIAKKKN